MGASDGELEGGACERGSRRFEVAHRLVQDLENTGLKLGDDGRVTSGDAVLARATRDDHLRT